VSLTSMSGLDGVEPGQGCNITPVFSRLIVRPKRLSKLSMSFSEYGQGCVRHDGAVISERKLAYQSQCDLGFGSETSQIKDSTVSQSGIAGNSA